MRFQEYKSTVIVRSTFLLYYYIVFFIIYAVLFVSFLFYVLFKLVIPLLPILIKEMGREVF